LSTATRSATIVSVWESGATPGSFRYPSYCPRTTWLTSTGVIDSKTLLFSSRKALAVSEGGGSMATMESTCMRWVTTMSR